MKRWILFLLIILLGSTNIVIGSEPKWEVPIFASYIQRPPNILFILDNSGSMNVTIQATVDLGYLPNDPKMPFEYSYDTSKCYTPRETVPWWMIYTGGFGSGWYMVGSTNRPSIGSDGIRNRGPGFVWVYFNYHEYCERYSPLHWGGINSKERRENKRIYYNGTRNYDYDNLCPSPHWYYNYIYWLRHHARIRYIGDGNIWDIRGVRYSGRHYVIDLPRANLEFNNDTRPGHPPFGISGYNPAKYPPNKRMIPVIMDDLTDRDGKLFLDPNKLPKNTYDYWAIQPAVRMNLGKFGVCLAIDPVAYGLPPYEVKLRFGLMKFDDRSWNVSQGGRLLFPCKEDYKGIDDYAKGMLANTNTPLAETLYDAGRYFKGELPRSKGDYPHPGSFYPSPLEECQNNFVVYLTDGEPCGDAGYDGAPLDTVIGNYDKDCIDERRDGCWPSQNLYGKRASHTGDKSDKPKCDVHRLWQGTDYLDDTARYFYDQDLSGGPKGIPGIQNLVTYTIGLYIDYCMLRLAAEKADGLYFPARDAVALKKAFEEIMTHIVARVQSGGAVAVAVAVEEEEMKEWMDKVIRARFFPDGWRGYLEAFNIPEDEKTFLDELKKGWPDYGCKGKECEHKKDECEKYDKDPDGPKEKYLSWRAQWRLKDRSPDSRRIFTYLYNKETREYEKVEFIEANLFDSKYSPQLWELLEPEGGNETERKANATKILRYIRGHEIEGFRSRERDSDGNLFDFYEEWEKDEFPDPNKTVGVWRLQDIVSSSPMQVGPPRAYYADYKYKEFKKNYRLRERMVYVGSNSMFHAFTVGDKGKDGGDESWAYIPSNLLGRLKYIGGKTYGKKHEYHHLFYVNLTPSMSDVKIDGEWRTILVGGEREGGDTYFCLDVTGKIIDPPEKGKAVVDYESVKVLWEYKNLGESWCIPQIDRIKHNNNVKWVAFITSGPDKSRDEGYDRLSIIDIETGNSIRDIRVEGGSGNALTTPAIIDTDGDHLIDHVYIGDLKGNLWKISDRDNKNSPDPSTWECKRLFKAMSNQPITAKPTLTVNQRYETMILFGTGKFEDKNDIKDTSQQSFYAIIDRNKEISRANLKDKTTDDSDTSLSPDHYGWFIDLKYHDKIGMDKDKSIIKEKRGIVTRGERVTKDALVYRGMVIFTSFEPKEEGCKLEAWGYLYVLAYDTGGMPERYYKAHGKPVMDITDDMVVDEKDVLTRSRSLDHQAKHETKVGIPSKPVLDKKHDLILTQISVGGKIAMVKVADIPLEKTGILNWREF